jgi:hypothetical protein
MTISDTMSELAEQYTVVSGSLEVSHHCILITNEHCLRISLPSDKFICTLLRFWNYALNVSLAEVCALSS